MWYKAPTNSIRRGLAIPGGYQILPYATVRALTPAPLADPCAARADDALPARAVDSGNSPTGYLCPECGSGHLWFVAWVAPTRLEGG